MNDAFLKLIFAGIMLMLVFFGRETMGRYDRGAKTMAPTVAFTGGPARYASASVAGGSTVAATTSVAPAIRPWNMVANPILKTQPGVSLPASATTKDLNAKTVNFGKPSGIAQLAVPAGAIKANATLYLVSDLLRPDNIVEQNAQKRWPLASLTKLMTAAVVSENIPLGTPITISQTAEAMEGEGGGLKSGEAYSAEDLLKALFLVSSNDAAKALAEFYGEEKFVNAMNSKAQELGLTNTFFKETTGLSTINQSTPNDLKTLMRFIYTKHPKLFTYSQNTAMPITELTTHTTRIQRNINLFAGRSDFLGGKTGFIEESGENLVSLFSRGGQPILIIVMDANDRFKETEVLLRAFDTAYRQ